MKKFALALIKLYQKFVSPATKMLWPGGICRFSPTCSEYTAAAIEKFGVVKGALIGLKRVARCQPFSKGGFEQLP